MRSRAIFRCTSKTNVVIINESMARKLWPGENPLGKRIGDRSPYMDNPCQIVGVVTDVRPVAALVESEGRFQIYYPLPQRPPDFATIAMRKRAAPEALRRPSSIYPLTLYRREERVVLSNI